MKSTMLTEPTQIADYLMSLFHSDGHLNYGENISQQSHAEQSAHFAQLNNGSDTLVVAALLHDIGHFLHSGTEFIANNGIDTKHEIIGAQFLERFFSKEITQPIRLHVAAKRYLARDNHYFNSLSDASKQSLELQGGAYNLRESKAFERSPAFNDAIELRRADDFAKIPNLSVPPLENYYPLLVCQIDLTLRHAKATCHTD